MQRLLRHVVFVPVRVRAVADNKKPASDQPGGAFHRERQTSGRETLFQIDGFSLDRAVNGAPDLIGQTKYPEQAKV
jgi:hypothetical protein